MDIESLEHRFDMFGSLMTKRIRLIAPPVEGKANKALQSFLAEIIGVLRSKIEIVAGATGRD